MFRHLPKQIGLYFGDSVLYTLAFSGFCFGTISEVEVLSEGETVAASVTTCQGVAVRSSFATLSLRRVQNVAIGDYRLCDYRMKCAPHTRMA